MKHVLIENRGIFHCSLRRAFEVPMLGDATKFLSGYRMQPGIIGFEDDSTWGQVGGLRYPVTNGNCLVPPGRLLTDRIIERSEDSHWHWEISGFRGTLRYLIDRASASWEVSAHESGGVNVVYAYRYYPTHPALYPALQLFAKIQLEGMHRNAFREIQRYAESDSPLVYDAMRSG